MAPRFRRERALLQHRGSLDLGFRRRRERCEGAAPEADRRSGNALPRGSGAHAAGGAIRGEARLHASIRTPSAPIRRLGVSARRRTAGAPVRRVPEIVLVGFRRQVVRACCSSTACSSTCSRCPPRPSSCRPTPTRGRCSSAGLANTDARIIADKPVTPTFLFAILLWSAVLRELNERRRGPAPDLAQLMQACDTVLKAQQSRVSIPRRFAVPMRELLMLQPRFNRRSGVKSLSLLQHPRFRAAYDFLLLRARGRASPIPSSRSGGPRFKCCRRRSGSRWSKPARRTPAADGGARRAGPATPASRGGAAAHRAANGAAHECVVAPRLCGDRQQSRSAARTGRRGLRAHRAALAGTRARAALAAVPHPSHGAAGSAGLRQCRGRAADPRCARTSCSRRLLGDRTAHGPRTRQERWGPRVIDLDLVWMVGRPVDDPG